MSLSVDSYRCDLCRNKQGGFEGTWVVFPLWIHILLVLKLSLLFNSCHCLCMWKCCFRHFNTSLAPGEGSHWNKEKEFKALLPVWEEDWFSHQLWMQVQCILSTYPAQYEFFFLYKRVVNVYLQSKTEVCTSFWAFALDKTELFLFRGDSSSHKCHTSLLQITPSVTSVSLCWPKALNETKSYKMHLCKGLIRKLCLLFSPAPYRIHPAKLIKN